MLTGSAGRGKRTADIGLNAVASRNGEGKGFNPAFLCHLQRLLRQLAPLPVAATDGSDGSPRCSARDQQHSHTTSTNAKSLADRSSRGVAAAAAAASAAGAHSLARWLALAAVWQLLLRLCNVIVHLVARAAFHRLDSGPCRSAQQPRQARGCCRSSRVSSRRRLSRTWDASCKAQARRGRSWG